MPGASPRPPRSYRWLASTLSIALLGGCVALTAPTAAVAVAGLPEQSLMVTEIVPDNVGVDNFEFFEVSNTTDQAIALDAAGVSFSYIYANSTDRARDVALSVPAGTTIGAGETVVMWIDYTSGSVDTSAFTESAFREHYASSQPGTDYRVVRVTGQPGFANGGDRGVRISDAAGEISRSYYPAGSVSAGVGADFSLPLSGSATELVTPAGAPSPGVVAASQLQRPSPGGEEPGEPGAPGEGGGSDPLAARDLVITEFLPDNPGTDRWEYVEIANTTDRDINLSDANVAIVYDYLTGTKQLAYPAGATVPAGGVAVLWLNYANTEGYTEADFRTYYGTSGNAELDGYTVIPVTGQDGFANSAERGIALVADGIELSSARYLPDQISSTGLGVDYRLPSRAASTSMAVLRTLAPTTPGTVDPEAFVAAEFSPQPDASLVTAPLQITEVAPDTANIAGADAYEFIEVYNSTSEPVNFRDYSLEYLYPLADLTNSSTTLWPATNRDAVIPAGGTIVFWIKNGANDALTATDFNTHFGSALVPDESLFEIESGGMANSAARGLRIVTNTGHIINRAYYWLGGVDDTVPDQPIQYAVNHDDLTLQTKLGTATASPGRVFAEQVDDGLMIVPADTVAPEITDLTATEIAPGADFPLSFRVTDDQMAKSVTLRLRSNLDDDFTPTELIGPNGDFSALIKAVDLTGKRYFEYELVATDGTNTVSTGIVRLPLAGVDQSPVRLNLEDGQWLRGDVSVIAGTDEFPSTANLSIDGAQVAAVPQLESAPVFAFEATGVDTFFRNGVKVGDDVLHIFDDGIYSGWETISTPVPLSYVTAGDTVTVSVWAGTKAAPEIDLNENNDDFSIRGLRLILPDGRTLTPTGYSDPTRVLAMGDSVGKLDYYDAVFTIPADAATAMGYLWETEQTSDGAHAIHATDGASADAATVNVDNTAPDVTTDLVEGALYQGEFTIGAEASDAGSGIASLTASLDGRAIELPLTTSSIKLADGGHTLELRAVDIAGNERVHTVTFSTPVEEPGNELISPEDGAEFAEGDEIELRARATDPTGDVLQVSLNRGYRLEAGDGVSVRAGATTDADETDRSAARVLSAEEVAQVARIDDDLLSEVSGTALPYQLFDVAVPADAGAEARVRVRWDGTANAEAKVRMLVLTQAGTWEELDRAITDADGLVNGEAGITFEQTVPVAGHLRDGLLTVLVQHSEGFAGTDFTTRDSFVNPFHAEAVDRSAYDFTLAWESDTQYYNEEFHQHQTAIHEFLIAERENLNLQYLFHTGDIVDDYDQIVQWENANPEYAKLDAAGIPYGVLAGNHDVGHKEIDYTNYGSYFGADRFSANPWWGGDYENNRGHYDLVSAGGIDFLVLSMGWGPEDDEIAWMNRVLAEYPERVAVINLHEYMLTTGGLGPIPQRIYDEVIATNANVRMVMSGHYHDAYTRIDAFDDDGDGTAERQVVQMLFDYQGLPEGGQGYLRLMHFDNLGAQVLVRTYSPSLLDFNSDDPSLELQHQEFTIPYATIGIQPREKALSTDAFTADVLTADPIVEFADVESGTEVAGAWEPGIGTHGWYAASADPHGATADSEVRLLTVVEAGEEETPGGETPGENGPANPAPAAPATPVAGDALTADLRDAIDTVDAVRVGEPFTVTVGAQYAGQWVQVWLQSTGTPLGTWTQVSASGTVTAIVPAGTPAGEHTIVVQAADGTVIGWTTVRVSEAAAKANIASLERTGLGAEWASPAGIAALAALVLGGGLLTGGVVLRGRRRA